MRLLTLDHHKRSINYPLDASRTGRLDLHALEVTWWTSDDGVAFTKLANHRNDVTNIMKEPLPKEFSMSQRAEDQVYQSDGKEPRHLSRVASGSAERRGICG